LKKYNEYLIQVPLVNWNLSIDITFDDLLLAPFKYDTVSEGIAVLSAMR